MRVVVLAAMGLCLGCAPLRGLSRGPPASYVAAPAVLELSPAAVVFQDSTGALSYRAPQAGDGGGAGDVGPRQQLEARHCQSGLRIPLPVAVHVASGGNQVRAIASIGAGWGEGGYARAISELSARAGGRPLVDVQADLNTVSLLGVWVQCCVVVRASVLG